MPGGPSANVVQIHFRYYNDDNASEASNTVAANEDTNISLVSDAQIILRIQIEETAGPSPAQAIDPNTLQYSKNGGTWTNVTTVSSNVQYFNSLLTDGGATTKRLTGTASFTAGAIVEGAGLYSATAMSLNISENVYAIEMQTTDLVVDDTLDFRISGLNVYTVIPRVTIISSGPSELTYCAGGDAQLEWDDVDSWDGPEGWTLTESGSNWTLTNGASTWTTTSWDGTGSRSFTKTTGTNENLTITVTAGACVCKEHYVVVGKKTGLLTTSKITAYIPKNDYRATVDPNISYNMCAGWSAGSRITNLTNNKVWECVDAVTGDWVDLSTTSVAWGSITGTLASQTDLNTALNGKQALDADLTAIAALTGTGISVRTGTNTWATRTLGSSAATITVTNPSGLLGNINFDLPSLITPITRNNANVTVDAQGRVTATSAGSHTTLSNIDWVSSGHTGATYSIAGWNASASTPAVTNIQTQSFVARQGGNLTSIDENDIAAASPTDLQDSFLIFDVTTKAIKRTTLAQAELYTRPYTFLSNNLAGNYSFSAAATWLNVGSSITITGPGRWLLYATLTVEWLTNGAYWIQMRMNDGTSSYGFKDVVIMSANVAYRQGASTGPWEIYVGSNTTIQLQGKMETLVAATVVTVANVSVDGTSIQAVRVGRS